METHSMKLSMHCSWANLKATWSLEVSDCLCRKLATSAHYAHQYPLTPLCHFTWPTTLWLSCCRLSIASTLLPLTVDCGIFRNKEISRLDLLHSWYLITVPCWNSLSSWERPVLSQMFVTVWNSLHAQVLLLYTCGHESDWNTWFQSFGWVSEYFSQYSIRVYFNIQVFQNVTMFRCNEFWL